MPMLYVLFEHAAGYALFSVKEFEEIGMLLPEVEKSVTELNKFNQIVTLNAFNPFKSAVSALEGINSISEGILPDDLQMFLERTLPGKKKKVTLGVSDAKLGAALSESLGLTCSCTEPIPEIIRGLRMHFPSLVQGFSTMSGGVAQLGLGHSYSRAKVKFNVNRVDNMIIQSIALLDQLDKDINTFSMRIREWYSYHFPELYKIVPENYIYSKTVKLIGNRKELNEEKLDLLEEIVMDRSKAEAIVDASKSSMGMDISPVDLLNIEMFASRVIQLVEYRSELCHYLESKMSSVAPNLREVVGDQIGARLISKAGSLTNLAKFPASTVQILGAEKALFRALKTKGRTPKYGLLYHSSYIAKAGLKEKGRISRYVANKCSIASRIDCFMDVATNVFGCKLKQQIEDRLKYYSTNEVPKKNIIVMQEAAQELIDQQAQLENKKKKKKKKKKNKIENGEEKVNGEMMEVEEPPNLANDLVDDQSLQKKKKKKKKKQQDEEMQE